MSPGLYELDGSNRKDYVTKMSCIFQKKIRRIEKIFKKSHLYAWRMRPIMALFYVFKIWKQKQTSNYRIERKFSLLSYCEVKDCPGTNTRVVCPSSSSSANQQREGNTTGGPLGAVTSTSSTNTPWLGDAPSQPMLMLRTCIWKAHTHEVLLLINTCRYSI